MGADPREALFTIDAGSGEVSNTPKPERRIYGQFGTTVWEPRLEILRLGAWDRYRTSPPINGPSRSE